MTTELTPDMLKFIENIALYYENYGIPRIAGRMFGLFLITTTPLSAAEIGEALDASVGSVSTNLKLLIANGWVEKSTSPGDRTTYYRFAPTAWENVMRRRQQSFAPLQVIAQQMQRTLPPDNPAAAQLNDMLAWTDMLTEHYENLIAAWKAHLDDQQK